MRISKTQNRWLRPSLPSTSDRFVYKRLPISEHPQETSRLPKTTPNQSGSPEAVGCPPASMVISKYCSPGSRPFDASTLGRSDGRPVKARLVCSWFKACSWPPNESIQTGRVENRNYPMFGKSGINPRVWCFTWPYIGTCNNHHLVLLHRPKLESNSVGPIGTFSWFQGVHGFTDEIHSRVHSHRPGSNGPLEECFPLPTSGFQGPWDRLPGCIPFVIGRVWKRHVPCTVYPIKLTS